jgi:hypothetical protein
MGWKDLLQTGDERIVSPWVGGRTLRQGDRTWKIEGDLPPEHGWYSFKITGRTAKLDVPSDPSSDPLNFKVRGYLVGDRLVPDDAQVTFRPTDIVRVSEQIHLVEPGLDLFVRVVAGRMFDGGPLVFELQDMPLGPEDDVLRMFLDDESTVDSIKGVPPALDAAFRMERWRRVEAERRRQEIERVRREEEERQQREERRTRLIQQLGDAAGRRAMAVVDFGAAARAALAVGGAAYVDHRPAFRNGEVVVRFRLNRRRFECTCDQRTLRIIDAGICLTAHYDDEEFAGGTKGDTLFTLESLPAVILQAEREGKLVVFRHAD